MTLSLTLLASCGVFSSISNDSTDSAHCTKTSRSMCSPRIQRRHGLCVHIGYKDVTVYVFTPDTKTSRSMCSPRIQRRHALCVHTGYKDVTLYVFTPDTKTSRSMCSPRIQRRHALCVHRGYKDVTLCVHLAYKDVTLYVFTPDMRSLSFHFYFNHFCIVYAMLNLIRQTSFHTSTTHMHLSCH